MTLPYGFNTKTVWLTIIQHVKGENCLYIVRLSVQNKSRKGTVSRRGRSDDRLSTKTLIDSEREGLIERCHVPASRSRTSTVDIDCVIGISAWWTGRGRPMNGCGRWANKQHDWCCWLPVSSCCLAVTCISVTLRTASALAQSTNYTRGTCRLSYRATQRPSFPETESQHNSFKVVWWQFFHNTTN